MFDQLGYYGSFLFVTFGKSHLEIEEKNVNNY